MEVMVAVGEGMENGDVRGIKMEVDEEMDNCYEDMMDEVLEETIGGRGGQHGQGGCPRSGRWQAIRDIF